ncbi:MAG: integrase [Gaiellales bacterium]|jgi:integrase|nr:integrase [Gaiellales bacterium]
MQRGTITKHGRGYRGSWREDGKRRTTPVCRTQGEAKRLLKVELDRLELGASYRAPITFSDLYERFRAQHDAAPATHTVIATRMKRPLELWGDVFVSDLTEETIKRWLVALPVRASYRHVIARTLRQIFNFGVSARLIDGNPAKGIRVKNPARGERILPFESWAEVERVADECGRFASLVILMADCGARPGEMCALEHRHVEGNRVYLPGTKTDGSRRVVHLTERGIAAYKAFPRSISTPLVFYGAKGGPVSWSNFRWDVWYPALELAGLEQRSPYQLRHSFAVWSLRAGVPISDLAAEMGHTSVARTFTSYGAWVDEMGSRAASMRSAWASGAIVEPGASEGP